MLTRESDSGTQVWAGERKSERERDGCLVKGKPIVYVPSSQHHSDSKVSTIKLVLTAKLRLPGPFAALVARLLAPRTGTAAGGVKNVLLGVGRSGGTTIGDGEAKRAFCIHQR